MADLRPLLAERRAGERHLDGSEQREPVDLDVLGIGGAEQARCGGIGDRRPACAFVGVIVEGDVDGHPERRQAFTLCAYSRSCRSSDGVEVLPQAGRKGH